MKQDTGTAPGQGSSKERTSGHQPGRQGWRPYREAAMMRASFLLTLALAVALVTGTSAGAESDRPSLLFVAGGSCQVREEGSADIARAVALYRAKRKVVGMAGKRFADEGLIGSYGPEAREIYSLAAEEISARILEEGNLWGRGHSVRIEAAVDESAFVNAEARNRLEEVSQRALPYREEMEQEVPRAISPGVEIARAYRLLRQGHLKLAIIYLNNLDKKYPHWGELLTAKAMAFLAIHREDAAREALKKACELGDEEACGDSTSLPLFSLRKEG